MKVDTNELIKALTKVLEPKSSAIEPTVRSIKLQIEDFIETGLSGELTGKEWSERYSSMQRYYLSRFLNESTALGFESNPIEPSSVRKVLNTNKKSTTEKRNRHAAIVAYTNFLIIQNKLPEARLDEIKDLRPIRGKPVNKRFITREDLDQINNHVINCKFTKDYDKNLLLTIIEIAEETGLRIGELCAIKLCDIDFKNQELYIPRAKGGSDFTKGLTLKATRVLENYLLKRPTTESLELFVLDNGKPLTRETLIQRFRRITKKLGLDTSFHAIRRRYITRHLQDGKSLVDVSIAVNHKSPRMTEQYLIPDVQRSIEAQKQW
jgi:integrase